MVSSTTSLSSNIASWPKDQVRIVFDGDGVLFLKEPEPAISGQSDREMEPISLQKVLCKPLHLNYEMYVEH